MSAGTSWDVPWGAATASALLALAVLMWPSRRAEVRPLPPASGAARRTWWARWTGRGGRPPGVQALPATVVIELVAAAMKAGLPAPGAVAAAARVAGPDVEQVLSGPLSSWRLGVPADVAWAAVDGPYLPLARALVLAERTGASAAVLLTRAASDARAARQRRARVAARRLGVQLVLPLGLTTLPSFVLWGVAPVVLGLAGQLLGQG